MEVEEVVDLHAIDGGDGGAAVLGFEAEPAVPRADVEHAPAVQVGGDREVGETLAQTGEGVDAFDDGAVGELEAVIPALGGQLFAMVLAAAVVTGGLGVHGLDDVEWAKLVACAGGASFSPVRWLTLLSNKQGFFPDPYTQNGSRTLEADRDLILSSAGSTAGKRSAFLAQARPALILWKDAARMVEAA